MRFFQIVTAYLIGSIPFGLIIVKILTGKDLRWEGSGATGGTNTFRTLRESMGTKKALAWAVVAGTLDILKAFFPTWIAVKSHPDEARLHVLVASGAVTGHTKPIFLGFRGGKAVSTTAGVLIALASKEKKLWSVFQFALGICLGALAGTGGIVSVASLTGSAAGGLYALILAARGQISKMYGLGLAVVAFYIWLMHWENIGRLRRREEKSIITRR